MKGMFLGLVLGSSLTLNVVGWISLVAAAKQIKELEKKVKEANKDE